MSSSSSIQPRRKNSMGEPPSMAIHNDATLMNEGPPTICQLNTKRKYIDGTGKKVRRLTYGRKDGNKQNKVILLVGETGAGKTTLINTMINYLLGVKFEDQEFYQITEDDFDCAEETTTQTSEITVYEVFVEENPTSLTIIDTPGYANTEGYEKDREISEYLTSLFSEGDGIHYIDAVCFVMKATQNRLSGKELYIFHSVLSLFGRDIENNIVFLLTHSDGGPPTDALNAIEKAQIHWRRDAKKQPVHFLFNNQQKKRRDEQYKLCFRSTWEMADASMNEFFKLLEENNRKSVQMTLDVLKERRRLEACVSNLRDRINEKQLKMKELNEIQEALRQNRHKIQKCKNFQFTVKTVVKKKVSTEREWWHWWKSDSTCCSVCEENCHVSCWDNSPSFCEVMKRNHCTSCTGKCHYSDHVKENKKYVVMTNTVIMTFDALKQYENMHTGEKLKTSFDKQIYENITKEHEANMKEAENKTEREEKLKSDLEKNKEEKSKLMHEAYISIVNLAEIALKADSAFTLLHLDFLIPRLKEEGKEEWVKKLEDLRRTGEEPMNKRALLHVMEFTGQKRKQFDSSAMAASYIDPHQWKSMDETPEKIAGVIHLKDEFIDLYERDHPHLQQCTERLHQIIETFGNAYRRTTEGSRIAGLIGLAAIVLALASAPLSLGLFLFGCAAVMFINAAFLSRYCSSEKKHHMTLLRTDIEARLKEFQDKIKPMTEKMKEVHERNENMLRGQDVIKMADITGLTEQISQTMNLTENIASVYDRFSLVLDIISVDENNRVLEDMQRLAETPLRQETDEEIKSSVGKFIVEMRKLIHQLQNVVSELEKTKDQLAIY